MELEVKERKTDMICNKFLNFQSEVELREKSFSERIEAAVEMRKKELREWGETIDLRKREIIERYKALELEEKQFVEIFQRIEAVSIEEERAEKRKRAVDEREKKVDEKEREVNEFFNQMVLKEGEYISRVLVLKQKEEKLEKDMLNLELKQKELDEKSRVLELKGKKIKENGEMLELKEKQVHELRQALELKEKEVIEGREALDLKEKEVDERWRQIVVKEKEMNEQLQSMETQEKHMINYGKCLISTENQTDEKELNEHYQIMELEQKQLEESCLVKQLIDKQSDVSSCLAQTSQELFNSDIAELSCAVDSSLKIGGDIDSLCRNMDVDGVRSYLIENLMEQKALHEKILDALGSAPDPGKLVLDVSKSFHQIFPGKEETNANKSSCIFLLERLMKLSPPITSDVKDEAKSFADLWKTRLNGGNTPRDNFGFLQLVAAFKLGSLYDAAELLSLFNIFYGGTEIYLSEYHSYLCHVLGLEEKIPGVIESLMKRQKWLLAVKYICVFKLECDFPPVPLLESHLELIRKRVNERQNDRTSNLKELEKEKELNVHSQFTEWKERQVNEPCLMEESVEKQSDGALYPCLSLELEKKPIASKIMTQENQVLPRSDIAELANAVDSSIMIGGDIGSLCRNMDVDGVKSYLIENLKEQKALHEKILDALGSAPDPGKLVLDVIKSFHQKYPGKEETNANKSSCIFLLERLMKLSPPINCDVKDEAKSFADLWKTKLNGGNTPRDNLGFLHLIAAFKLANLYNAAELLSLFSIFYNGPEVHLREQHSHLCHVLGLSDKIPGLIKSLIEKKKCLLAVKYICVFGLKCDFPPAPLLESHLELLKKRVIGRQKDGTLESKKRAACLEASNLRDLIKCIASFKLESQFPPSSLELRLKELEKEKERSTSAELRPEQPVKLPLPQKAASVHHDRESSAQHIPRSFGHSATTAPNICPMWEHGTMPAMNGPGYGVGPCWGSDLLTLPEYSEAWHFDLIPWL
ncbi:FRIGIDA-like protein 5 isoform X2 [Amaranthus tricolor]|uniref:FRIGIDA-like protein 5 isoform X2 n=1 Tax=Amaranthus tricolor TaxID=29722 RepID=UPI002589EB55|nr:FRIGIDA-like protein 5 isoform X2 [Amaranthus tricolor]